MYPCTRFTCKHDVSIKLCAVFTYIKATVPFLRSLCMIYYFHTQMQITILKQLSNVNRPFTPRVVRLTRTQACNVPLIPSPVYVERTLIFDSCPRM